MVKRLITFIALAWFVGCVAVRINTDNHNPENRNSKGMKLETKPLIEINQSAPPDTVIIQTDTTRNQNN